MQYFRVQLKVRLPVRGIFSVHTDVNACDCTQGMYGHHKRVCAESVLWEKNPLPHGGIKPASAAWQSDALATELHPCLSSTFSPPIYLSFCMQLPWFLLDCLSPSFRLSSSSSPFTSTALGEVYVSLSTGWWSETRWSRTFFRKSLQDCSRGAFFRILECLRSLVMGPCVEGSVAT